MTFFTALEKSQYAQVSTLLSTNLINLDIKDKNGQTPLIVANARGDKRTVELLYGSGADINRWGVWLGIPRNSSS
ncbi:MAG: Fibronectin type 3 and ankyrin repeat domains protein 1 [Ramalina farinacea]|uniref:Fibronectin type 3 and ankyrin repeat domains protein 1 n=1 Tax=Ramalina farinacea TaxID=258253 RepID=A0AA43QSR9_9LECA|nr:Fibronectin type 3 and ankyrin repeat domains protein 1 [Ramalina farinacea]